MAKHDEQIKKSAAVIVAFALAYSSVCFLLASPSLVNGAVSTLPLDAEVKFVVGPDGTVGLAAKCNLSSIFPSGMSVPPVYSGVAVHMSARIAESDGVYEALMNETLALPSEEASQFPLSATTASSVSEYSDGMVSTGVNASLVLPRSTIMQGMPMDFSGFPFNSTDFTLSGEYADQSFNGTITVHLLPGFTFGDVAVSFQGNLTQVTIDDSVKVFYNYSLPIPVFPDLNETYVRQMLQMLSDIIRGRGPGSLYNMTLGALECTSFDTTITPIDSNSAEISFYVVIQGDFIQLLTYAFVNQLSTGGGIPPDLYGSLVGSNLSSTVYSMLNATWYSTQSARLVLSYSRESGRLDFQTSFTSNTEGLWNLTGAAMSDLYPPEMQPYLQSILEVYNMSFSLLKSYKQTMSYANGQFIYSGNYTYEGDLNEYVNSIKNAYIDLMDALSAGLPQPLMSVLRESDVNVGNLTFSVDVVDDSASFSFENLQVAPPVDSINATCFKLKRFFGVTSSSYEPPRQNERLKLIVQGGSNGTHSVTLSIDPNDPLRLGNPDEFASGNTMIWNNMSISRLGALIFKVWEGHAEAVYAPGSITESNPRTIDAEQSAGCALVFTNVSEAATIIVKNTTSMPSVGSTPTEYKMLGDYLQIVADPEDVAVNVTLRIYYTHEQLSDLGLTEEGLTIFKWDNENSSWEPVETHLNTTEHYAWANIDHLSVWALLGEPAQALWQQMWFIASVLAVVGAVIVVVAIVAKNRR
jgi:hypothetical protein